MGFIKNKTEDKQNAKNTPESSSSSLVAKSNWKITDARKSDVMGDLKSKLNEAQDKVAHLEAEIVTTKSDNETTLKWTQDHILHLETENEKLKTESVELKEAAFRRTCKICMDEEVSHVFQPCGHAICCGTCVEQVRECPCCRKKVQKASMIYFS